VEKRETCIGRESNSGSLVIQSGDWPLSWATCLLGRGSCPIRCREFFVRRKDI
jgi:hypothetical protein